MTIDHIDPCYALTLATLTIFSTVYGFLYGVHDLDYNSPNVVFQMMIYGTFWSVFTFVFVVLMAKCLPSFLQFILIIPFGYGLWKFVF
jgi:hypothetical protein